MPFPAKLAEFLQENHVLCLSTAAGGQSYSAPVFYVFLESIPLFAFLSEKESRHGQAALENPACSAAIYFSAGDLQSLRGAQILGTVTCIGSTTALDEGNALTLHAFIHRHPDARGRDSFLWHLRPDWIKFTDNRRGFGFKEIWSRR